MSGRGILAFHGTDSDFQEFEFTEDIGFHFGSVATAEKRLLMIGEGNWPQGANVRPVLLDIRRPLRLPDLHDWNPRAVAGALVDAGVVDLAEAEGTDLIDQVQVARWLERAGYDSIVYANATESGGDSWIVLQPDQVRPWWRRTPTRTAPKQRGAPAFSLRPLPIDGRSTAGVHRGR